MSKFKKMIWKENVENYILKQDCHKDSLLVMNSIKLKIAIHRDENIVALFRMIFWLLLLITIIYIVASNNIYHLVCR